METLEISLFILLVALSFISSATEAAYLSLDRVSINRFENSPRLFYKIIYHFIENTKDFFTMLLIVNLVCNLLSTLLYASLLDEQVRGRFNLHSGWGEIFVIFSYTLFVLLFLELLPKQIGIRFNQRVVLLFTMIFVPAYYLFLPITKIYGWLFDMMTRDRRKNITANHYEGEFFRYLQVSSKDGALSKVESAMIRNLMAHKDLPIRTLMIPRVSMEGLDVEKCPARLWKFIQNFGHSHIVVYRNTLDNVVGVISLKKLFYEGGIEKIRRETLGDWMFAPEFISDSLSILETLDRIYESNIDLFIVVDEFGGVQGLVTYNDIIDRVLGRMSGAAVERQGDIRFIGSKYYLVKSTTSIVDFNHYFGLQMAHENIETIGGYLIEKMGKIPVVGDRMEDAYFIYTVKSATEKRVEEILIRKKGKML